MKLKITGGEVEIDDADFAYIRCFTYYVSTNGYALRRALRSNVPLANDVMREALSAAPKGTVVDHINHNKLDCRRANLRLATSAQNHQNAVHKIGKSGFRGVAYYHDKRTYNPPCWRVNINVDGVSKHLGYFEEAEMAARVYDAAARKYHGEFAVLNFPDEASHDNLSSTNA